MAVIELFVRICLLACCHTCGVAVIELFVRICLLACVSCVTCMSGWHNLVGLIGCPGLHVWNLFALSSCAIVAQVQ